ncbi:MAG: flagellar biosynthetic protein FliR [FCB group bacterium]|nr:flagellar biosynthetic protein FliR [FCB group bacterium]
MLDLINFGAEKLQLFVLLAMRVGGLMVSAPIFSHRSIPRKLAISMTLGLTVVLISLFIDTPLPRVQNLIELLILCSKEIFIGLMIGMVFSMIFLSIRLAGSIVGYQIGFAMVNVMDPNSSSPVAVLGEFWYLLATLFFLLLNGHHIIISGLVQSFSLLPLGLSTPTGAIGEWFMKYSTFVFVLAVKFAAPVMMTIFLIEISMGILARTMPQMNIFIVGFPLKIFVGLLMVGLSLPVFAHVLNKVCLNLDRELANLMSIFQVKGAI